jgi:hypothetical protein
VLCLIFHLPATKKNMYIKNKLCTKYVFRNVHNIVHQNVHKKKLINRKTKAIKSKYQV